MSLVGPRPPLPREVAGYDLWHRRRLSMKPGITGLWQVAARREEDFDRWVELDLAYIDRWSVWLDLKIIAPDDPGDAPGSLSGYGAEDVIGRRRPVRRCGLLPRVSAGVAEDLDRQLRQRRPSLRRSL